MVALWDEFTVGIGKNKSTAVAQVKGDTGLTWAADAGKERLI